MLLCPITTKQTVVVVVVVVVVVAAAYGCQVVGVVVPSQFSVVGTDLGSATCHHLCEFSTLVLISFRDTHISTYPFRFDQGVYFPSPKQSKLNTFAFPCRHCSGR